MMNEIYALFTATQNKEHWTIFSSHPHELKTKVFSSCDGRCLNCHAIGKGKRLSETFNNVSNVKWNVRRHLKGGRTCIEFCERSYHEDGWMDELIEKMKEIRMVLSRTFGEFLYLSKSILNCFEVFRSQLRPCDNKNFLFYPV